MHVLSRAWSEKRFATRLMLMSASGSHSRTKGLPSRCVSCGQRKEGEIGFGVESKASRGEAARPSDRHGANEQHRHSTSSQQMPQSDDGLSPHTLTLTPYTHICQTDDGRDGGCLIIHSSHAVCNRCHSVLRPDHRLHADHHLISFSGSTIRQTPDLTSM